MTTATASSAAVAAIAEMITPALLILGSASLVATALVRLGRVVDRSRVLAALAQQRTWDRQGLTAAALRVSLARHQARARCAERSVALFYSAIVLFIATCLSIALDRVVGALDSRVPLVLAFAGTLLLLAGGAFMVAECRLGTAQLAEEIRQVFPNLEEKEP